jgi:hypothetical protein
VTVLTIRISETGGNPWKFEIDNLAREDATDRERSVADQFEVAIKAFIQEHLKPGSQIPQLPIKGTRV